MLGCCGLEFLRLDTYSDVCDTCATEVTAVEDAATVEVVTGRIDFIDVAVALGAALMVTTAIPKDPL